MRRVPNRELLSNSEAPKLGEPYSYLTISWAEALEPVPVFSNEKFAPVQTFEQKAE
jgi:hypothetical protein